jgi:dihydrodipicolinate synthase/N-acetylneuraminate lyase
MEVRDALPDSVRMYTSVLNVLQGFALGASGALLAENNVIPNVCRRIADGWATRDLDMASDAARTVQRFSNVVNRWAPSTARWVKMALHVLDLPAGNGVLRRPYLLPPESEQAEMAQAFDALRIREAEGLARRGAAVHDQVRSGNARRHGDGNGNAAQGGGSAR